MNNKNPANQKLTCEVVNNQLVIRIGINKLAADSCLKLVPKHKIINKKLFAQDVAEELTYKGKNCESFLDVCIGKAVDGAFWNLSNAVEFDLSSPLWKYGYHIPTS